MHYFVTVLLATFLSAIVLAAPAFNPAMLKGLHPPAVPHLPIDPPAWKLKPDIEPQNPELMHPTFRTNMFTPTFTRNTFGPVHTRKPEAPDAPDAPDSPQTSSTFSLPTPTLV